MEKPQFLHVHSPIFHHATGHIIGNKAALKSLKIAINAALKTGVGEALVYGYDGEGYVFKALMYDGDKNQVLAVPYTDANAKERREDAIWPSQLSKIITDGREFLPILK